MAVASQIDSLGASKAVSTRGSRKTRIGFVPLCDCAPIVLAQELGIFARHGLRIELVREVGWATVRDRLIHGDLDASHALAPMPFAATLGIGCVATPCVTGLVLNLNGNAITLSKQLWKADVRDGASLANYAKSGRKDQPLTFGIVSPMSSHRHILESWLRRAGLDPERDVRFVVVPPPQMPGNLKAGHLDGFCSGEPWNSVAIRAGDGWCPVTSSQLLPDHVEKVLMVRRRFVEERPEEHLAILSALIEACAVCETKEGREAAVDLLARPSYVNAPAALIRRSFDGLFDFGNGREEAVDGFMRFHANNANDPDAEKGTWVVRHCLAGRVAASGYTALVQQVFRRDLYLQAIQLKNHAIDHASI